MVNLPLDGRGQPDAGNAQLEVTRPKLWSKKRFAFAVHAPDPMKMFRPKSTAAAGPSPLLPLPDRDGRTCSAVGCEIDDGAAFARPDGS